MKEMADIRADFRKRQDELDRDFSSKQLSKDLYEQQTEALKAALAERLAIQDDYQKQSDAQQSDWRAGISDSLMNYADQAKDLSSMSATATSEILNNATNSISTNMTNVLTGATSFKDGMSNIFTSLGESVIQSLIQMATQALITKAILASVGGELVGCSGVYLEARVVQPAAERPFKVRAQISLLTRWAAFTIHRRFLHTAVVYTALRSILLLRKARACSVKPGRKPLCR